MRNFNLILSRSLSVLIFLTFALVSCDDISVDPDRDQEQIALTSFSPTETYVKTAVNVLGTTNFDTLSNVSVLIGGVRAEILTTQQNSLTAKVPLDIEPGTYQVTVSSGSLSSTFEEEITILDHTELTLDGMAVVLTDDPSYPIIMNHENGEHLILESETQDGKITGAIYKNGDTENRAWFDEMGRPEMLQAEGTTYLFQNYEENTVDVGVISPEGEIFTFRDIALGEAYESLLALNSARTLSLNVADQMRAASLPLSIMGCAIAGPLALTGNPIFIIGGVVSCSSALLNIANYISDSETLLTQSALPFGVFADHLGCTSVMSPPYADGAAACISLILTIGAEIVDDANTEINARQNEIDLIEQSLMYNGGDIQITLTWDNESDLDLHVIDPFDERIAYFNVTSNSGGALDVDDVDGFGPENIYWLNGQAPQGEYFVEVDYFSGQGEANFTVLVQAGGYSKLIERTLSPDETQAVATFNLGEPISEILLSSGRYQTSNREFPAKE